MEPQRVLAVGQPPEGKTLHRPPPAPCPTGPAAGSRSPLFAQGHRRRVAVAQGHSGDKPAAQQVPRRKPRDDRSAGGLLDRISFQTPRHAGDGHTDHNRLTLLSMCDSHFPSFDGLATAENLRRDVIALALQLDAAVLRRFAVLVEHLAADDGVGCSTTEALLSGKGPRAARPATGSRRRKPGRSFPCDRAIRAS